MENDGASRCLPMQDNYNQLSGIARDGRRHAQAEPGIGQNDVTAFEITGTNSTNPSNMKAALLSAATRAKGRWRHD